MRQVLTTSYAFSVLLCVPLVLILGSYLLIYAYEHAFTTPAVTIGVPLRDQVPTSTATASVVAGVLAEEGERAASGASTTQSKDATVVRDRTTEPIPPPEPQPPAPQPAPKRLTPSQTTSEPLSLQEQRDLLSLHNDARDAVGVSPLVWSDTLALSAQVWSDTLAARGCVLEHSYNGLGENIYYSRKYGANQTPRIPEEVIGAFLDEANAYDADSHTCDRGAICGHYTQIVWSETTHVGCAKSICQAADREEIWTCHYAPPGNVEGEVPF